MEPVSNTERIRTIPGRIVNGMVIRDAMRLVYRHYQQTASFFEYSVKLDDAVKFNFLPE